MYKARYTVYKVKNKIKALVHCVQGKVKNKQKALAQDKDINKIKAVVHCVQGKVINKQRLWYTMCTGQGHRQDKGFATLCTGQGHKQAKAVVHYVYRARS